MAERNLITDVPGVLVGHAQDDRLGSGVTAIVFEEPAVASIDVRGGGPGTREVDMLEPAATLDRIDGIALSGGSAFGLEAELAVSPRFGDCPGLLGKRTLKTTQRDRQNSYAE